MIRVPSVLLVVVGLATAGAVPAVAVEPPLPPAEPPQVAAAPQPVAFTDTFNRVNGPVGNGWAPLVGDWAIVSNAVRDTGGPNDRLIAQVGFEVGETFAIETDFRWDGTASGKRWSGVAFHVRPSGAGGYDYLLLRFAKASTVNSGEWQLLRVSDHRPGSAITQLALVTSGLVGLQADTAYAVKITTRNPGVYDVSLHVNSGLILFYQTTITVPAVHRLTGGHAGLYVLNGGFRIDETIVYIPLQCLPAGGPSYQLPDRPWTVTGTSLVDTTWSGHPVGQSVLTAMSYVGTEAGGPAGQGQVSWSIPIFLAGDRYLWARVRATGGNPAGADSFHVQMDSQPEIAWHHGRRWDWQWVRVTSGPEQTPVVFPLAAGGHTLRMRTREAGSQVDAVFLTADPSAAPPFATGVLQAESGTVTAPMRRYGVAAQYVAYYNANRQMVVARRTSTGTWIRKPLDSVLGWDSHNSVTMGVDRDGHLHVSGNMHVSPLVYFRTTVPGDVTSLQRVTPMVDPTTEDRVTYPRFHTTKQGDLLFEYRDGSSGNGNTIYNRYDEATRSWRRYLDTPLFDGEGLRNAYPLDPVLGPDGYYHLLWVWRRPGGAQNNEHLSHARSLDLRTWQTAAGQALPLPIRYDSGAVIDPVPVSGGILNGGQRLGFDAQRRPMVLYYKYDAQGGTQLYLARPGGTGWTTTRLTNWLGRWHIRGGGSGPVSGGVGLSPPETLPDGNLRIGFSCVGAGSRTLVVDPVTLATVTEVPTPATLPAELTRVRSTFPGMGVRRSEDLGGFGADASRTVLRWESLASNQDQPRNPPLPDPSPLEVYLLGQ